MKMIGQRFGWEHICHMCQGKAAKGLHRQVVKRGKRREERQWRKEFS